MSKTKEMIVVCGIVIQGERVLACRRDPSRHFPLMWEFPGGKVEHGESSEEALHRELEEELRLSVRIMKELDPVFYQGDGFSLRLLPFLCQPAQASGPLPLDHVELRWITVDESRQLTWAPADIPLVNNLQNLITASNE